MPLLSLQSHWLSAQAENPIAAGAIAVGPRGFKSALQSLINFLIKHEVRANIWLKLPKDDAWWTDIWQYGQQAAGCTIYALGKQDCIPSNELSEHLAASLRAIAIEQDNDLKREYLCVAVADNFAGALLAARIAPSDPSPDKRNLKLYSTISGTTVSAVGEGLKQIVERSIEQQSGKPRLASSQPDTTRTVEPQVTYSAPPAQSRIVTDALLASHAMLSQWHRYFPNSLSERKSWPLAEAYLTWQLQFQEELRSQLAICRSNEKNSEGSAFQSLSPEFISRAGQELQAPLTTIKTALTLLGSPAIKLAQRQRYLAMIAAQCDRQKSLIDGTIQLLQLQMVAPIDTQPIQLADLIPGIVSTYQPIAEERGIMLAYTVPSKIAPVIGVEAELKEVLIQLIKNAIRATPHAGRVWVAAVPHNDEFVALTVTNSGAGMSKAEANKLFEAFYRRPTNSAQDAGVGLGLTLVQQLIQRIGGSVRVQSEPGEGTTFEVRLPTHPTADQATSQHGSGQTDPAVASETAFAARSDSLKSSLASV